MISGQLKVKPSKPYLSLLNHKRDDYPNIQHECEVCPPFLCLNIIYLKICTDDSNQTNLLARQASYLGAETNI